MSFEPIENPPAPAPATSASDESKSPTEGAAAHAPSAAGLRAKLRLSSTARIALALVLGIAAGRIFGPFSGIGEIGRVLINVIKALAGPLLFLAIVDAFLRTRVQAKSGLLMIGISAINACFAVTIGLLILNVFHPGRALASLAEASPAETPADLGRSIRFREDILGLIPTNLIEPFRTNSIIAIVILAVLAGAALRSYKAEQIRRGMSGYRTIDDLVACGYRVFELMLGWVVATLPIAVFAVIEEEVGKRGFKPLGQMSVYVLVMASGLFVHVLLTYQGWVLLALRMPLARFWSGLRDPLSFAAGASSSLATLPVTLASLKRMGVSDESARMAACVGTNLNNDGILLYEAMAAVFVAQAYGIPVSLPQQLMIAGLCVIAGVGIAGVPEAGLISLALVLTTAKLPLGILPLLLSVDWILSRLRAMTNVTSDMLVALLLDRFQGAKPLADASVRAD